MAYFIELIKYIILGIIQGITEIFPVSSSGHLVIFSYLFMGGENLDDTLTLFLMITNMGSFFALLLFYFKDVKTLVSDSWSYIFKKTKRDLPEVKESFHYSLKLLIAVIPIGIAGLFFKSYFDDITYKLLLVGISLIVTAILLTLVFMLKNKKFTNELTWKHAGIIGLFQMFAVIPGISRSGITIVGGLSQKIDIKKVLKFSFLSYIVVSIPVSILGLYDAIKNPGIIDIPGYILAFIFSFIFSLLTIKLMHKYVKVHNLIYFAVYALCIGIISITLQFI